MPDSRLFANREMLPSILSMSISHVAAAQSVLHTLGREGLMEGVAGVSVLYIYIYKIKMTSLTDTLCRLRYARSN